MDKCPILPDVETITFSLCRCLKLEQPGGPNCPHGPLIPCSDTSSKKLSSRLQVITSIHETSIICTRSLINVTANRNYVESPNTLQEYNSSQNSVNLFLNKRVVGSRSGLAHN